MKRDHWRKTDFEKKSVILRIPLKLTLPFPYIKADEILKLVEKQVNRNGQTV